MALGVIVSSKSPRSRLRALLPWSWLGIALASTSCTPGTASGSAQVEPPSASQPLQIDLPSATHFEAGAAPAVTPAPMPTPTLVPAAGAFAFRAQTPLDGLRSHDCLAQAIYYEAASESEDGQRAVAQVVLNRVRHPSWPNSVCGVVYQGPMRPGGGCQFTFTCDGSLSRRPSGAAWAQARRLAGEALAGRVFPSVGLATHYHTHAVAPAWAPRLARIGSIGAHAFYRLPGHFGQAEAFASTYSGIEPIPRPTRILFPRAGATGLAALTPSSIGTLAAGQTNNTRVEGDAPPAEIELPSTVRDEYRHSGQWRADAPAAITGR